MGRFVNFLCHWGCHSPVCEHMFVHLSSVPCSLCLTDFCLLSRVSLPIFRPLLPRAPSHSLSPLLSFSRPSLVLAHCSHMLSVPVRRPLTPLLSFPFSLCVRPYVFLSVCVSLGLPLSVFLFFTSLAYSQYFPSFPLPNRLPTAFVSFLLRFFRTLPFSLNN